MEKDLKKQLKELQKDIKKIKNKTLAEQCHDLEEKYMNSSYSENVLLERYSNVKSNANVNNNMSFGVI